MKHGWWKWKLPDCKQWMNRFQNLPQDVQSVMEARTPVKRTKKTFLFFAIESLSCTGTILQKKWRKLQIYFVMMPTGKHAEGDNWYCSDEFTLQWNSSRRIGNTWSYCSVFLNKIKMHCIKCKTKIETVAGTLPFCFNDQKFILKSWNL